LVTSSGPGADVIAAMRGLHMVFTPMSPVRHVHGALVSVRRGWLSIVPLA
jgi:hypothetical protein